jgi:hypothetical protein
MNFVNGPFVFVEVTVTAAACLDMMEDYTMFQVPQGYLTQQAEFNITPT